MGLDKQNKLRPLSMKDAMQMIAGDRQGPIEALSRNQKNFLDFLENNEEAAKELGAITRRHREEFATAYPGQTRTTFYTNEQWERAGFHFEARANRLMGLDRS